MKLEVRGMILLTAATYAYDDLKHSTNLATAIFGNEPYSLRQRSLLKRHVSSLATNWAGTAKN